MGEKRSFEEEAGKNGLKGGGRPLTFNFGLVQIGWQKVTIQAWWTVHAGQCRKEQHWRHWWGDDLVQKGGKKH